MQIVIDDEKIIDLLEMEWGYEGIREDITRVIRENGIPLKQITDEIRQIVDEETEHDETWARGLLYSLCIIDKYKAESEVGNEMNDRDERYCTECPYFKDVIYEEEQWYGARCKKDGHITMPSMYAIKSLHNNCPLTAESEYRK